MKEYRFTRRQLIYLLMGTLLLGIGLSYVWHRLHTPMKAMYVDLYNKTTEVIPSMVIQHGNMNTQEKIQAIRIQPGEHRIIALNHQPKLGFSITANYADGKSSEICAGKLSEEYYLRANIWDYGVYIKEIR